MNISLAGVVEKDGKFLVALRKPGTSIGEKWEFPGGKKEKGESLKDALRREFLEELKVEIRVKNKLCEGYFLNDDRAFNLKAFSVEIISGEITKTEHQEIKWVDLQSLKSMDFPESDKIIIDYLLSR